MVRICHISTVHNRFDIRIFVKQLTSLQSKYECHFIVADNQKNLNGDVNFWDVGKPKSRLHRMLFGTKLVLKKAIELDCTLYHLHD
ncbi:MAG TPA: glycosyl transferase, partial [Lachnoclostridium phytofermentans]|nr:glycosyl transferase [Lachnoclostridium phytofermentans]